MSLISMNRARKLCLRISILLSVIASIILLTSYLTIYDPNLLFITSIYLFTSAALFASPYMVIPDHSAKNKLDALMIMGSSGFYATALIIMLFMIFPFLAGYSDEGNTVIALERISQMILGFSFLATLLMHCWSTVSNAKGIISLESS